MSLTFLCFSQIGDYMWQSIKGDSCVCQLGVMIINWSWRTAVDLIWIKHIGDINLWRPGTRRGGGEHCKQSKWNSLYKINNEYIIQINQFTCSLSTYSTCSQCRCCGISWHNIGVVETVHAKKTKLNLTPNNSPLSSSNSDVTSMASDVI